MRKRLYFSIPGIVLRDREGSIWDFNAPARCWAFSKGPSLLVSSDHPHEVGILWIMPRTAGCVSRGRRWGGASCEAESDSKGGVCLLDRGPGDDGRGLARMLLEP